MKNLVGHAIVALMIAFILVGAYTIASDMYARKAIINGATAQIAHEMGVTEQLVLATYKVAANESVVEESRGVLVCAFPANTRPSDLPDAAICAFAKIEGTKFADKADATTEAASLVGKKLR